MTQTPKTLTRIPRFLIATFLIGFGLPLVAMAQKAGKPAPPTADMAVTTTVRDADANIAPVLQITSDGALYSNTRDVQSLIQGIGDWVMQSDFSSTRTVFVDFSQPIAGSCPSCANGNPVALPHACMERASSPSATSTTTTCSRFPICRRSVVRCTPG